MAVSMSFQNTKENSGTRYIFITQTMVFRVRFNLMESTNVCYNKVNLVLFFN